MRANTSIVIRKPRRDELPKVAALFREILKDLPYYNVRVKKVEPRKYTPKELLENLRRDKYSVICAFDSSSSSGEKVVGFLFNHFDDYTIWADWFGVSKKRRNQGIGTMLNRELFRTAKLRRCHKVWCDCRTNNRASIATLRKLGFQRIAEIKKHWYGLDYYLWEKFL